MYRLAAFADEADRTLRGQISAMKDNGIELLEIRTVDGKNIAELTAAEAKTIRKELDGAGIAVWSVRSPIGFNELFVAGSIFFDGKNARILFFPVRIFRMRYKADGLPHGQAHGRKPEIHRLSR